MSAQDTVADTPAAPALPAPARRGPGGTAVFACLLAASALGASGWLYLQAGQLLARVQEQDDRIAVLAVPRDDPRLPALEKSANALAGRVDESAARAAALDGRVLALEAAVGAMAKADRSDWALAEAEYLERLANQRLQMAREVRGSIALLESADAILRELDDPRLHAARAALAADVASLRAVADFDLEGIHNRLAALAAQLPALAFQARSPVLAPDAEDAVAAAGDADDAWSRVQAVLARFVVVRQREEPVRPLLPAGEERQLRMNIRLALEQAKLALLAAEAPVYRSALADAGGWVRQYLGAEAATNRAFLRELDALAAIEVAPVLPAIDGSLNALRAHIAAMHGEPAAAPAPSPAAAPASAPVPAEPAAPATGAAPGG